ncbi:MAG: 1-deoxy-D-xylulose-5-phosphate synthase, partial [Acidobacteriota bacterium]
MDQTIAEKTRFAIPKRAGARVTLQEINSPSDLRRLRVEELGRLAEEAREFLVSVVSQKGGHLGPSLGVVELTFALHYVFDTPLDKIVWDVGHQAYIHKILTGRREDLWTIRQLGGISGFVSPAESPYDHFGVAHASTSISAALGFATARDAQGEDYRIVTVTGDGAMTGGMAYEGLNNAGHSGRDLLVILNDNEMSISPNVGAISHYLTSLTTNPFYKRMKNEIYNLIEKFPKMGMTVGQLAKRMETSLKSVLVPGALFQALGFTYHGPLDGHNLPELVSVLSRLRKAKGPVLLHILTRKGRGYPPAEASPDCLHGVSPSVAGKPKKPVLPAYTRVFADTLTEMAREDSRIVAVTAAMADGTGLVRFQKQHPKRFFDVGIAEAHAVTFSAGLAASGLRPVTAIYSTFIQRAYDQLIHDVAIQKLPVVFVMDRAGLVGPDGPTHHGVFDFSFLRPLPNFVVSAPKDGDELRDLLATALTQNEHPFFIRYPKESCGTLTENRRPQPMPIGSWEVLADGESLALLAVGSMVRVCQGVIKDLRAQGIVAGLVNCRFVKPVDRECLRQLQGKYPLLVTVEENAISGGFGHGVYQALQAIGGSMPKLFHRGIPDRFICHGTRQEVLDLVGLS